MSGNRIVNYKGYEILIFNDKIIESNRLVKIYSDSVNWRVYFKNDNSNWILFYPFSEYHGGGQPYIINIKTNDFDLWLNDNPQFEIDVKKVINKL